MIQKVLLLCLSISILFADIALQGHVELQSQAYLNHPQGKHSYNNTAFAQVEATYTNENLEAILKASAQGDYYDLKSEAEKNRRSFVRLDEAYVKYDFDDAQVMAGKSIRFWGALEVDNIVDGFNPDDFRSELFNMDKLGVYNAAYTYYTDTGELSFILKSGEPDQKMAAFPYVYYFFPANVNYDANLQSEKNRYRPTIYLSYSGSTDTQYALDYAFILQNGYDSQHYFTSDAPITSPRPTFTNHVYLVNKAMSYNTLVVGSTLLKLEALYADVINDKTVSDYYHLGLGVEHTLTQVYKNADLGILCEYYKYHTLEDGKYTDLQLFETFQNDLFLGLRYSFNEGDDASIIGGVIADLDYAEQSYYIEYESRIAQTLKLNLDYRYIEPSQTTLTAFNLLGRHQRLSLKLGYYF